MKSLNLFNLESIDHIVTPVDYEETTLKSPALNIFTNFKQVRPLTIDSTTKASDVLHLMEKAHVNLKLVLSKEHRICGVVSNLDVSNQKLIKLVSQGENRENILVTDLMQPRSTLLAFDYKELKASLVEDVLKTLEHNRLQHCLVVEHVNHEICGLISASDIARKLHIPINIQHNPSFADLYSTLHS